MFLSDLHHTSFVMLGLILVFAIVHSGGAAIRSNAEKIIGPRLWRLIFASLSIPSAIVLISYFLVHRYDGIRLWNVQGLPGIIPLVWVLTAISFFFLYPATYNLLEIPAVIKPKIRIYGSGIIRISRHPQAIGQILWCFTHALWIGTTFTLITCAGLIGHHLFAVWHGDRRLKEKFGEDFEELKRQTSVFPFLAVLDGRQKLKINEFLRPSQLGIVIAVLFFWWAHRYIYSLSQFFIGSPIGDLLG